MTDLEDRDDTHRALEHLEAGDWEAAHAIVQDDVSRSGAWAHGIVHMLEGDMANAGYWYRRAGRQLPAREAADAEIAALRSHLTSQEPTQ